MKRASPSYEEESYKCLFAGSKENCYNGLFFKWAEVLTTCKYHYNNFQNHENCSINY